MSKATSVTTKDGYNVEFILGVLYVDPEQGTAFRVSATSNIELSQLFNALRRIVLDANLTTRTYGRVEDQKAIVEFWSRKNNSETEALLSASISGAAIGSAELAMPPAGRRATREEYLLFLQGRLRLLEREREYLKRNLNRRTKWELEQVEGALVIIERLLADSNTIADSDIMREKSRVEEMTRGMVQGTGPEKPPPHAETQDEATVPPGPEKREEPSTTPPREVERCAFCGRRSDATNLSKCSGCDNLYCVRHIDLKTHRCESLPRVKEPTPSPVAPPPTLQRPTGERADVCFTCGRTARSVNRYMECDECHHHYCGNHIQKASHGCEPSPNLITAAEIPVGRRRVWGNRPRVRWSYVFLIIWAAGLLAGLYLVPGINPYSLFFESFFNGFLVFFIIWGIAGISRRGPAPKALAVLLLLLVGGVAFENQGSLKGVGLGSVKGVYTGEANALGRYGALQNSSATSQSSAGQSAASTPSTTSLALSARSSASTSVSTSKAPNPNPAGWLSQDPSFQGTQSSIGYPPNYATLVNFTLGLINGDRAAAGLGPVTLSQVPSGQQHADSMAYFGYFSHWDTQGYKPYMRYSMLGGAGAVAENLGLDSCTTSPPSATLVTLASCSVQNIENGLANSEWGMMNNDVACCANGHRDNILDPTHNRVSLGISYSSATGRVYLVEDFEDLYLQLSQPIQGSLGQVEIVGGSSGPAPISELTVFYDPLPAPMTVAELDSTFSYDPGTFVGGVLPPCSGACEYFQGGISAYASAWQVGATSIDITFSMSSFFAADGPGVYTVYLQTGSSTGSAVLTYSIFNP